MGSFLSVLIAYLIGSLSFSIILAKLTNKPDPRSQGSGNAGATNVLRSSGRKDAIIVLVGDALKGVVAILIGHLFGVHGAVLAFVGLACVVGHVFPLYFKFKGGKGVATALGVIITLSFWVGITAIIVWLIVALLSKYASLASLSAMAASVVCMLIFSNPHYAFPVFLIAVLVFWKHNQNIQRLAKGRENKIKLK